MVDYPLLLPASTHPTAISLLLLPWSLSQGCCSENVGLREEGQLTSGNRGIYSCAATVPRANRQSAIHTYEPFLWARSQGTACLVLCLRYHRLQSSCPLQLGFHSEAGVGGSASLPTHVAVDSIQFSATVGLRASIFLLAVVWRDASKMGSTHNATESCNH